MPPACRRMSRKLKTSRPPISSSGSSPISTDSSEEDIVAAVAVTWTWWAAREPARPLPPSATGMVVVNDCPPARLPVTWPAGPIVTARTIPAPTSARNWV